MSSNYNISNSTSIRKLKRMDLYNIFLNIIILLLLTATILLVVNPSKYMKSINAGINLFFLSVFPSLLPFLFLSKLLDGFGAFNKLTKILKPVTTKIFKAPSITTYPFLMTLVSGYPIGAKIIGDLYNDRLINSTDAKRMIVLSSTSGPIFVIGSVGAGMLGNTKLGLLIFVCHIIGSIITALLFTIKKPKNQNSTTLTPTISTENILHKSTNGTIMSILTVAVYVSIFYMFIDMAYDLKILSFGSKILSIILPIFNIDSNYGFGLSSGLIEMTRGCKEIIALNNDFCSLIFCSSLISFGGLSIILQSLTFLHSTKIKATYFIFFKFMQMIITLIISIPIGLIFL